MAKDPMRMLPWPPLTEKQKDAVANIKGIGDQLWRAIDAHGASRELALAKTNLEAAVMWAVKAITTPEPEEKEDGT